MVNGMVNLYNKVVSVINTQRGQTVQILMFKMGKHNHYIMHVYTKDD